jgi:alcohol dehydrogenase class IV
MLDAFTYEAPAQRVVFGRGKLSEVGEEVRRLGRSRALVLSTLPHEANARRLSDQLGPLAVGVFSGAVMHTPVEVTERALREVQDRRADCIVSLGGGSTTGLGKAIALQTGLDQVVIPTTYAGSEATPILGQTDGGRKTTLKDKAVLPEVVIYDVDLTLTLPPKLSASSGLNAMAHAVEALYAPDGNPVTSMLAEQGIAALACALPSIVANPTGIGARTDALFGAWACGTCLGTVGMSLHHKLCHVLGGTFDLPHAETHAIILPYAVAYNAAAAPDAMARIAHALSMNDAALGIFRLARKLGLPSGLHAIGLQEAALDQAADLAVASPYPNPAPLDRTRIRSLLQAAWKGEAPSL